MMKVLRKCTQDAKKPDDSQSFAIFSIMFMIFLVSCEQDTREQITLSWKIHTKMVYQKQKKQKKEIEWKMDKQWKIWVTLNSIVPTSYKYSLVPLQLFVSKSERRDWIHALISIGVPNSNFV